HRASYVRSSSPIGLKHAKTVEPLSKDSTVIILPRSPLGQKSVEVPPGHSRQTLEAGDTLPIQNARPVPVEIDQVFNMFTRPTRTGIQQGLVGFGDALASRGPDLNQAFAALRPLVRYLQPVAENLASSQTQLAPLFRALPAAASAGAPVAATPAGMVRQLRPT